MPLRQHDACGPESSGRAQHGADILRVGDLIEHKKEALGRTSSSSIGEGLGLEHDALMHGVGVRAAGRAASEARLLDAAGLQ